MNGWWIWQEARLRTDMTFIAAEHQVGRVVFADISEANKIKILGENAREVLKIKTAKRV